MARAPRETTAARTGSTVNNYYDGADIHNYHDRTDRRRDGNASGFPYSEGRSWIGIIAGTALAIVSIVVVGLFLTTLVKSIGCQDQACYDSITQIAESNNTARRAIANSNANARAGFGNNDLTTKQLAVPANRVVPRPATIVAPVKPSVIASTDGIRYTGKSCIRKNGDTGREGYQGDALGCWRI